MRQVRDAVAARDYAGLLISEHDRPTYTEADQEVCRRLRELAGMPAIS